MRRIIALLTVATLLVMALAVPAFAEKDPVTVCHNTDNNPHEINVSENASAAHDEHGDTLVVCDNDPGTD
jgi:ABC-type sugar transport system substrate-binding protein